MLSKIQPEITERGAVRELSLGSGSASVFPTGEAFAVNVGTARKPCWVVEGPKPNASDIQWSRDLVDAVPLISREALDRSRDGEAIV